MIKKTIKKTKVTPIEEKIEPQIIESQIVKPQPERCAKCGCLLNGCYVENNYKKYCGPACTIS